MTQPTSLIINSPYEVPRQHWQQARDGSLNVFGLDCTLMRMLIPAEGLTTAFDAHSAVQLFRTLLTCRVTGGNAKMKKTAMLAEIGFSRPACYDFMQVHTSGGVEWFNKERFEELSEWLAVMAMTRLAEQRPASSKVAAWLAATERDLKQLAELATHAGYRTVLFLRLLGDRTDSGKAIPQPCGKNSDN